MLRPEQLNGSTKLEPACVSCPELGGDIYVAQLTALQNDELEARWTDYRKEHGTAGIRAFFVAYGWADEENRLLAVSGDLFQKTVDRLNAAPAAPVKRAFDAFCELNGLLDSDVEDLAKNSGTTPDAV